MPDIQPASFNLRDSAGYLAFATHDLDELIGEIDRRRDAGEPVHLDDFTVTEVREMHAQLKRDRRDAEKRTAEDRKARQQRASERATVLRLLANGWQVSSVERDGTEGWQWSGPKNRRAFTEGSWADDPVPPDGEG